MLAANGGRIFPSLCATHGHGFEPYKWQRFLFLLSKNSFNWLERQFAFQFSFTSFVRFLFQKLCQNSLWGFPTGSSSYYYFSFILLLYCPQTEHDISANMVTMQINKMDQISPYEFSKFKPCSPYSSYNVHVIAFLV